MNEEITIACFKNRVKKYQVAEELGMTDSSFSRKLRKKLPEEEKEKILKIIEKLKKNTWYKFKV